ncbi:MAG: trypsin-like peptidase domain-containing protein, partial [Cyanobacteria bacterium REEB65]|nr:trypsin-like peptidase domain-containing protein [Cyanobacteria bacterium REEB65]
DDSAPRFGAMVRIDKDGDRWDARIGAIVGKVKGEPADVRFRVAIESSRSLRLFAPGELVVLPACPQCKSRHALELIYGEFDGPAEEGFLEGGCCESDNNALWHCKSCGNEWGRYGDKYPSEGASPNCEIYDAGPDRVAFLVELPAAGEAPGEHVSVPVTIQASPDNGKVDPSGGVGQSDAAVVTAVSHEQVCPLCGEKIPALAFRCRSCGGTLVPGFWIRSWAGVLDSLVLCILVTFWFGFQRLFRPDAYPTLATFEIAEVAATIGYLVFFLGDGTVGMWLCGLRAVRADGGRVSLGRSFGRYLATSLSFAVLGIGFLLIAFRPDKRALHDLLAGTRVVRAPKTAWGPAARTWGTIILLVVGLPTSMGFRNIILHAVGTTVPWGQAARSDRQGQGIGSSSGSGYQPVASGEAMDAQQIFQAVARSVFVVVARDNRGKPFALGSAVAISADSLITNFHVVKRATTLSLAQNGQMHDCQVARFDELDDLCRLVAPGLNLEAVAVRPSESLAIGEKVFAVGAPLGLELTLSEGIVSSLRGIPSAPIVQTTAAISPGSSGGGLFDNHGRLVGITTFQAGAGQSLNFALPTERLDDLNGNLDVKVRPAHGRAAEAGAHLAGTGGDHRQRHRRGGHRSREANPMTRRVAKEDSGLDAIAP